MMLHTLCLFTSLLGLTTAFDLRERASRTDAETGNSSLYAYGTNISGLEVIYGDGLAYIGHAQPDWLKAASNITFAYDTKDTSKAWTINSNSSVFTDGAYKFYIDPTASGTWAQVGFLPVDNPNPEGAMTTGFGFYGTVVGYAHNTSGWQFAFWARETNTSGLWQLVWNKETTKKFSDSLYTPVTLKNVAPVSQTVSAPGPAHKASS